MTLRGLRRDGSMGDSDSTLGDDQTPAALWGPHTVSPSLHLPREDPRTVSPSPRPPREGPRTPAQPPPREVHYTHQALPWRRVCAEYAWTWRRRLCSRSRETPPGRASKMQPAEQPLLLSGDRAGVVERGGGRLQRTFGRHRKIGRGSCRSALADGVERRSTAVVLG